MAPTPHASRRLTPTDERDLLLSAKDGDRIARDRLVESFLPLVAGVARIYRNNTSVERDELMQEGVVGLLRALRRYDPRLRTPFWAYASWWVRQAMQQLVSEMTRPIILSDRALRRLARIKDARREHARLLGGEPSSVDLAAATGFTREQIDRLLAAERTARGFDEPVGRDEGTSLTFGELIRDPAAEDAYARVLNGVEADRLHTIADMLADRERAILFAHYGLGRPMKTLREIADQLEISVERVRQIEKRALETLREAFENSSHRGKANAATAAPLADLHSLPADDSPSGFRGRLARELAVNGVKGTRAIHMLMAANEIAACSWRLGSPPERLRVGPAGGRFACEISGGQGARGDALSVFIAERLIRRIDHFDTGEGHTLRLWV